MAMKLIIWVRLIGVWLVMKISIMAQIVGLAIHLQIGVKSFRKICRYTLPGRAYA